MIETQTCVETQKKDFTEVKSFFVIRMGSQSDSVGIQVIRLESKF